MKMETISADSRLAREGEGVSRHPGFMSPITQNDGISMNNAAPDSCSGLECHAHKRHKKGKGRGCSKRLKPNARFKKNTQNAKIKQKCRNYRSKCVWFFPTTHICLASFFFLCTAELVCTAAVFASGAVGRCAGIFLFHREISRQCLKQKSLFTAE